MVGVTTVDPGVSASCHVCAVAFLSEENGPPSTVILRHNGATPSTFPLVHSCRWKHTKLDCLIGFKSTQSRLLERQP